MRIAHIIYVLFIMFLIWFFAHAPSNERDWTPDQSVMPYAKIEGDLVHVYNIRNFTYTSTTDYTINYYDKTYDLSKLDSIWYIVEPFGSWTGPAHTFISFGFGDEYVAISVEIRKEKGEKFSAIKGLFRQYELMYVIGDERDLIKLRSNYRKDTVYLYPIKAPKQKIRELFLHMIFRTNYLKDKPEFYNTFSNTCTLNIMRHINNVVPGYVPMNWKIFFPAYSDEYAYELGLIPNGIPFEKIREKYKINEKAELYADDPEFSIKIRKGEGGTRTPE